MDIAVKQLRGVHSGSYARGVRLRHYAKIRAILDEELEEVWKDRKAPITALGDAVERGNALLNASVTTPATSGRPAMPARPATPAPGRGCC